MKRCSTCRIEKELAAFGKSKATPDGLEPRCRECRVERDRGRCGVCGLPVRAADASVDHILPVSKGGAHSYANTRLAHLRCNKVRGNRGPAQLRMLP